MKACILTKPEADNLDRLIRGHVEAAACEEQAAATKAYRICFNPETREFASAFIFKTAPEALLAHEQPGVNFLLAAGYVSLCEVPQYRIAPKAKPFAFKILARWGYGPDLVLANQGLDQTKAYNRAVYVWAVAAAKAKQTLHSLFTGQGSGPVALH